MNLTTCSTHSNSTTLPAQRPEGFASDAKAVPETSMRSPDGVRNAPRSFAALNQSISPRVSIDYCTPLERPLTTLEPHRSGAMQRKTLISLNHLTVPFAMRTTLTTLRTGEEGAERKPNSLW